MRWRVLVAGALALLSVRAELVEARPAARVGGRPSTSSGRTGEAVVAAVDAVVRRYGLAGEVLVAKGDRVLLDRGYGPIAPAGGAMHRAGERWRLASITKQVVAAMIVRNSDLASLDLPIARPVQLAGSGLTLRQLLTHHSGLANPDSTPKNAEGVPAFYRAAPDPSFCVSKAPTPGPPFSYDNCDYLLAPAAARFTDGGSGFAFDGTSLRMAEPGERGLPGFLHGRPEPAFELTAWLWAGGMIGTARGVYQFDRGLMRGTMMPPEKRAALWTPEGHGSYQALGAWVFPGQLRGCAAPKRIVQRDGEIYGVQARNFILPEDGLAVIVFTNRSADDFHVGEVWQGRGFAYDLLSAAAC